ncbi:MAG TPA: 23S rRNA (adenine(2030)-N(6))-methyltransferase RlmJ [Rudaea sp.]|jgi:23S rRNA (adenine2030-N6)-methyltransferase
MNYRHAFHAGNFADVFKHAILVGLLQALREKPAPFCYFDSHAGAGRYDLRGGEAGKTREAEDGVVRMLGNGAPAPMLRTYLDLVTALNLSGHSGGAIAVYPGSPLIASHLMRDTDRAVLCEVQADEAAALKLLFAGDTRFGVHQRDGYAALAALLPPKERRGLVLIDPPFEMQSGEFRAIEAAMSVALERWATGIYAIWYPIKQREATRPFLRWFSANGARKTLVAELMVHADDSPLRLNGCGMVIVNAPWKFDEQLRATLPLLQQQLARDARSVARVDWLSRD